MTSRTFIAKACSKEYRFRHLVTLLTTRFHSGLILFTGCISMYGWPSCATKTTPADNEVSRIVTFTMFRNLKVICIWKFNHSLQSCNFGMRLSSITNKEQNVRMKAYIVTYFPGAFLLSLALYLLISDPFCQLPKN